MSASYFSDNQEMKHTKTISVTSGKGGVGKSTVVANLAIHLGKKGHRVLLLDGDFGMGNLDIMFNQRSFNGLHRVIQGERELSEVIVPVTKNVWLIPGGSGIYELARMDAWQRKGLIDQVNQLEEKFDFMLIDTASGMDDNVLALNSAAQETLVVVTPEPASLTDAYSLIKVLHTRNKENRFSIVCNMVRNNEDGMRVFKALSDVATQFLCVSLDYRGFIPMDPDLRKATKSKQLVADSHPRCPSSFAIQRLAENMNGFGHLDELKGGLQFFWKQVAGVA